MNLPKKLPLFVCRQKTLVPSMPEEIKAGRDKSIRIVKHLEKDSSLQGHFLMTSQKDHEGKDSYDKSSLHHIGVLARCTQIAKKREDRYSLMITSLQRVHLTAIEEEEGFFWASYEFMDIGANDDLNNYYHDSTPPILELQSKLKQAVYDYLSAKGNSPPEVQPLIESMEGPLELVFYLLHYMSELKASTHQEILETSNVEDMLKKLLTLVEEAHLSLEVSKSVEKTVIERNKEAQKKAIIHQKMESLKNMLGEEDEDIQELSVMIQEADLPEDVGMVCMKQLKRLRNMQTTSSEYSVTRTYIENLIEVPWSHLTEDNLDLTRAREILDTDHYGLKKAKKRILEYLAVSKLKNDMKGPILCFVGPPGTGKTTIAKSIARTLGRKFARISLGGVHNESEIRGHRRTYVGALPGNIVKAIQKVGTMNPVILLDEIDKVGKDLRGDPQAALLEVLDPDQNDTFKDHYIDLPVDISKVLFIATANQLSTISAPLRDRMEIIEVPSYTSFEKLHIAKEHLFPKQLTAHGIPENRTSLEEAEIEYVIEAHTREAGVRNLERCMAALCRQVAMQIVDSGERDDTHIPIDVQIIDEALGPRQFYSETARRTSTPGVATGMAYTQVGGDILFIEAKKMPGEGNLKLTGQLGDIMKESVQAALSYLKSRADDMRLSTEVFKKHDIHLHVPAGATPKDGPSAGITIFTALTSLLCDLHIKPDLAMTGEITLSGEVLPVGGIREKVISAHRAGIRTVILPDLCRAKYEQIQEEVREELTVHFVKRVEELPSLVFEKAPDWNL